MNNTKAIWLDVDPVNPPLFILQGHDDATAMMLALNLPNIRLLGISTVHGNASSHHTAMNAARCLFAFGGDELEHKVLVYPGASHPFILPAKHDPEIHGPDGLGGVEGLPSVDEPKVQALIARDEEGQVIRALEGMAGHIKRFWNDQKNNRELKEKVTIVSCGPMTNLALFISVYPELLEAVEEFVFMGGGVGLGNRSAVAEFNILCDPHAAQIVLDAPVPTVMIPLNVTHTAIFTREIHLRLLSPDFSRSNHLSGSSTPLPLPQPATPLRHTLSTLITFFSSTYVSTFGSQFASGPPLHDALTIAYVAFPELFPETKRYRVDVELSGVHTMGETVVDLYGYRDGEWNKFDDNDRQNWGREGKNCIVVQALNVDKFFDIFLDCVTRCDTISPLNKAV
ncbi:uridine nucleosidase [Lentinula detonsa]|uniref:Uridine nucleosidase n=1 Tax=Lentinula detonsa TaxID=2804962 RepID=A0AA38PUU3_9AGAR|nr:uridine nucleosidase [Lentinula detonsa]